MRQIITNIYKFDELPTEAAKERARTWWRECEKEDPAWQKDHQASTEAACAWFCGFSTVAAAVKAEKELKDCPWTGYCGDETARDYIKILEPNDRIPNGIGLRRHMNEAWHKEMQERLKDKEQIDETILANEYEFYESGEKV